MANRRSIDNPYGKLPGREGRSRRPDTRTSPNPDTRESPLPDTRESPDYNLKGGESLDVENLTPGESFDPETLTPPQSEVPAEEPDEFVGPQDTRSTLEKAIVDSFHDRYKTENLTPEDFDKIEKMARQAVKAGKTPGHIIFQMDETPELFGLEPRRFHRGRGQSHVDMLRTQAIDKAYEEMRRDNPRMPPLRSADHDPNAGFPSNVISSVFDKTGMIPKPTEEEQRERNVRYNEYARDKGQLQRYVRLAHTRDDRYPIHKSASDFAAEKYPDLFQEGWREEDRSVSGPKTLHLPYKLD